MSAKTISSSILFLAVLGTSVAAVCPVRLEGSEIGATHLVYEKAVKMKKVDASLFLPFLDQSRRTDNTQRGRQVHCAIFAQGKRGALPVKGKIRIRLLGSRAAAPWESTSVISPVDDSGGAGFNVSDILALVNEAGAANAGIELFAVDFDGGRGKKVTTLTMDCLHEESD